MASAQVESAAESAAMVFGAVTDVLKTRKNASGHWHMAAGLVLHGPSSKTLLCAASGTRCCPPLVPIQAPYTLKDCHAEVLVRRAFNFGVLSRLESAELPPWLEPAPTSDPSLAGGPSLPPLRWQRSYGLELVISDAPCGDGAVRPVPSMDRAQKSGFKPTGAKPVTAPQLRPPTAHDTARATFKARSTEAAAQHRSAVLAHSLQVGSLRSKAARSDLPASSASQCLSCSDKVASWIHSGMCSALTASCIGQIFLSRITVSADDEEVAAPARAAGASAAGASGSTAPSTAGEGRATEQLPKRVWAYALAVYRALIQRQPAYVAAWRSSRRGGGHDAEASERSNGTPIHSTEDSDMPWSSNHGGFESSASSLRQQVLALPFVTVVESENQVLLSTQLPACPDETTSHTQQTPSAAAASTAKNTRSALEPRFQLHLPVVAITTKRFESGRHSVRTSNAKAGTTPECFNLIASGLLSVPSKQRVELLHSSKGLQLGATKSASLWKVASRLSNFNMLKHLRKAREVLNKRDTFNAMQGLGESESTFAVPYAGLKQLLAPQYALSKQLWKDASPVFKSWHTAHTPLKAWNLVDCESQIRAQQSIAAERAAAAARERQLQLLKSRLSQKRPREESKVGVAEP